MRDEARKTERGRERENVRESLSCERRVCERVRGRVREAEGLIKRLITLTNSSASVLSFSLQPIRETRRAGKQAGGWTE